MLVFTKPDKLVVEIDGLKRFNEQSAAGAACAVNDAVDAPFLSGNNRHHVPVFTNRNELFLQRAVIPVGTYETGQRFLNFFLLFLDLSPNAPQRDARFICQAAVGKKRRPVPACDRAEVRQSRRALRQTRVMRRN